MKRSIFKPILGGLIIGTALFFAPFMLLKFLFWMCIIGGIMRMIFWRRHSHWGGPRYYMAYADKVRNMSQEDYDALKTKMNKWQGHCGHYGQYNWHDDKDRYNCHDEKDRCGKDTSGKNTSEKENNEKETKTNL